MTVRTAQALVVGSAVVRHRDGAPGVALARGLDVVGGQAAQGTVAHGRVVHGQRPVRDQAGEHAPLLQQPQRGWVLEVPAGTVVAVEALLQDQGVDARLPQRVRHGAAGDSPAARTYVSECVERGRRDRLNELPAWLCLLARLDRAEGQADAAWTHACEALALYLHMGCPTPAVRAVEIAGGLLAATHVPPNVEVAARLFGAAEVKRQGSRVGLPPAECPDYECDVALVRGQLPGDVTARAWQQGRSMRFEDAIAEALAAGWLAARVESD